MGSQRLSAMSPGPQLIAGSASAIGLAVDKMADNENNCYCQSNSDF